MGTKMNLITQQTFTITCCFPTANNEELSEMEDVQRALNQLKADEAAQSGLWYFHS